MYLIKFSKYAILDEAILFFDLFLIFTLTICGVQMLNKKSIIYGISHIYFKQKYWQQHNINNTS